MNRQAAMFVFQFFLQTGLPSLVSDLHVSLCVLVLCDELVNAVLHLVHRFFHDRQGVKATAVLPLAFDYLGQRGIIIYHV